MVHCFAGRSRSSTVVAAYVMVTEGLSLAETMKLIKDARPCAAPNAGFERQLRSFERRLSDARAEGRLLGRKQLDAANVGMNQAAAVAADAAAGLTSDASDADEEEEEEEEEEEGGRRRKARRDETNETNEARGRERGGGLKSGLKDAGQRRASSSRSGRADAGEGELRGTTRSLWGTKSGSSIGSSQRVVAGVPRRRAMLCGMRTKHADMKTVAVIKRARPPDGRDFGFY